MKIRIFLLIVLFFCGSFAYAGELASREAVKHYNEGVAAQKKGDFDTAEACYKKAMLLDPGSDTYRKLILNNCGAIYYLEGDYKEAEVAFKEALSLDPAYRTAQLNLGLIYDRCYDRVTAMEYWMRVFNIEERKPKQFIIAEELFDTD